MNVVMDCITSIGSILGRNAIYGWILVLTVCFISTYITMLTMCLRSGYAPSIDQLGRRRNNNVNKEGVSKMIDALLLIAATILLWNDARWFSITAIVWLVLELIVAAYKVGKQHGGEDDTK